MEFLKNNRRFSFKLDGVDVSELDCNLERVESANGLSVTYRFDGGLTVTSKAKKIEGYDAYEWVNYLENESDTPTGIVSELWDADVTLPLAHEEKRIWKSKFPDPKEATVVIAPSGSNWTHLEFYCDTEKFIDNEYSEPATSWQTPLAVFVANDTILAFW